MIKLFVFLSSPRLFWTHGIFWWWWLIVIWSRQHNYCSSVSDWTVKTHFVTSRHRLTTHCCNGHQNGCWRAFRGEESHSRGAEDLWWGETGALTFVLMAQVSWSGKARNVYLLVINSYLLGFRSLYVIVISLFKHNKNECITLYTDSLFRLMRISVFPPKHNKYWFSTWTNH